MARCAAARRVCFAFALGHFQGICVSLGGAYIDAAQKLSERKEKRRQQRVINNAASRHRRLRGGVQAGIACVTRVFA